MMNYIWLGLIVIAVLYAGWKDYFTDDKPWREPPAAVVLAGFESGEPWRGTETDPSMNDGAEDEKGASLRYDFSFQPPAEGVVVSEQAIEPGFMIAGEKAEGDTATISVASDVAAHLVVLEFSDKDGEHFIRSAVRLSGEKKWQRISTTVDDLAALPNNPGAKADAPLTLDRVAVRRSNAATAVNGTLWIDRVALGPATASDSHDHPPDTWMGVLTKSAAERSKSAIELAISLIGIMTLWLGLMRIAEKAGMVQVLARAVKPIMVRLFPDIPADSEAMGAILMNVAANMLGLGNAATPMGIKAMKELQRHNRFRDYASNAQCMLLSINTSSITLIPTSIIAYRAAAGSTDLMKFWPAMVGATTVSTIVAIIACKFLEKLKVFAIPADAARSDETQEARNA